jgi:hypothetical protein
MSEISAPGHDAEVVPDAGGVASISVRTDAGGTPYPEASVAQDLQTDPDSELTCFTPTPDEKADDVAACELVTESRVAEVGRTVPAEPVSASGPAADATSRSAAAALVSGAAAAAARLPVVREVADALVLDDDPVRASRLQSRSVIEALEARGGPKFAPVRSRRCGVRRC